MANLQDLVVTLAGKVGSILAADGTQSLFRLAKTGEQVMANAHGRMYEAGSRGKCFACYAPAVAMSAPATAAIGNIVWNPPGSGVNLAIGKVQALYLVTDADALAINMCYSVQSTVPTTTSAGTVYPMLLGAVGGPVGQAKGYGIATVSVAATPICSLFRLTAGIQTVGMEASVYDFEGGLVVPPGYLVSLHSIAAAGASGVTSTIHWEEVPII
jgi:hypothetical protein